MASKRPAIPTVPASADPEIQQFLAPVKEALEIAQGQRGDPLDAFVSKRDLGSGSVVVVGATGSTSGSSGGSSNNVTTVIQQTVAVVPVIPGMPTNLAAVGAIQNIILSWDPAVTTGYAYTEVYRASVTSGAAAPTFGAAVKVANVQASVYVDTSVSTGIDYYYWIRFANTSTQFGPYNSQTGTKAALNTVSGTSLTPGTVTGSAIASKTIVGGNIVGGTITGDLIAGATIVAGNIAAGTITGNLIAANTITANNISVTNLGAINANLGTIASGNITLDPASSIKGGMTGYNTGTGFYLGYTGNVYTFSVGSPTSYLTWDGTSLTTTGLTVKDTNGNVILASGVPAASIANSSITISGGTIQGIGAGTGTAVANSAISINPNGSLSGAGTGQVTISGLGYTGALNATYGAQSGVNLVDSAGQALTDILIKNTSISLSATSGGVITLNNAGGSNVTGVVMPSNPITPSNISTYISSAAIGTAQIGTAVIQSANIGTGAIQSVNIGTAQVLYAHIGVAQVDTLTLAGQAVNIPVSGTSNSSYTASGPSTTTLLSVPINSSGNPGTYFYYATYSYGQGTTATWTLAANIDGVAIDSQANTGTGGTISGTIGLQFYNTTLTPGNHTLTITLSINQAVTAFPVNYKSKLFFIETKR